MGAKMNQVGGLPIFFSATYTDPGSAAVTITTPAGFYPDYVLVCMNEATNPNKCEWFANGNANPGGVLTTGSSGITTLLTTDGITVAAGSIVLGTDVVNDNITGTVLAWRYSA